MSPVVLVFLLVNSGVFVAWLLLGSNPYMIDNFLISWNALAEGRYWTLVTSEFSHILFIHFFLNMYVLASFGPIVEQIIGSARFFVFYMAAAIIASFGHAGVSALILNKPELPALGASGAISGVILLFSLMFPRARILLFGVIPVSALIGALLFVGLDVAGLIWQAEGGGLPIGHGAHLGGAATGVLYYFLVVRQLRVRRAERVDFGDVATWRRLIDEHGKPNADRDQ